MMSSWLDHKQLQIIKGIGATPTDSNSAENAPVVVNLMAGSISLDPSGWSPNIPAIKNGGVWTDSPISDGRTLLAAPLGNVTEKITILISDSSYLEVASKLESLGKMASDCRDYWQGEAQNDPVYLKWWANCAPGAQYALLFSIEISPSYEDSPQPTIRASMTLEREAAWRWEVPPGGNPKLWTFYVNKQQIGTNKVLSDAVLITNSDHLITQTVNNKFEWSPTAAGLQTTPLSKNYIDISAAQVPGDAPALAEMAMFLSVTAADIYVGKTTIPRSGIAHNSINHAMSLILNVGDSVVSTLTKTAGAAADSVLSNGSSVAYSYGKRTVTGIDGSYVTACGWGNGVGGGLIYPDRELYRGTYAVFIRAANQSGTPTLADMHLRLTIQEDEANPATQYTNQVVFNAFNPPLSSVQGQWPLTYVGTITLPLSNRGVQSLSGYGRQFQQGSSNLSFLLEQKVEVATANRILVVLDLILMPIDEGLLQIVSGGNVSAAGTITVIDTTGYISRGGLEQSAVGYANTNGSTSGGVNMEARGKDILLTPHTNQRLYFINDSHPSSGLDPQARVDSDMIVRLNIVPRSYGIRTV